MNVLLIMTDQHRADAMGCADHPVVRTPNLDALAAEGLRMERAYCSTPLCVPSRTTIFTSRYARHHDTGLVNRITLDDRHTHLPGLLREQGYELALVGKNHAFTDEHLQQWDFVEMYDLHGKEHKDFCSPLTEQDELVRTWRSNTAIVPPQEGVVHEPQPGSIEADPNVSQTNHALRFLQERDRTRPFFMYFSFESPHFPYVAPEPYFSMCPVEAMPGPIDAQPFLEGKPRRLMIQHLGQRFDLLSKADFQRIQATYLAQISLVDNQIGRVLDHLQQSGEFERTLILFVSDHGEFWGHHGFVGKTNAVYEDLLRVPMIWRAPSLPVGQTTQALVEVTDIAPTILDILGLSRPDTFQGQSMKRVLTGEQAEFRREIVAESHLDPGPALTRTELEEAITHHEALRAAEGHGWFGPRQRGWVRSIMNQDGIKLITNENETSELYDLNTDPHEVHNLIEDKTWAATAEQLAHRLAHNEMNACEPVEENLRG